MKSERFNSFSCSRVITFAGMPELGFPGKASVGFCKSPYLRNPNP